MIYNDALFELEDLSHDLVATVLKSPVYQTYLTTQQALRNSQAAQQLKNDFLTQQATFEKLAAYGKYAPGYKKAQQALFKAKRSLDLQPEVAAFKLAETELQQVLDAITQTLAETVSPEIKVAYGNPFEKSQHCKGNCHG